LNAPTPPNGNGVVRNEAATTSLRAWKSTTPDLHLVGDELKNSWCGRSDSNRHFLAKNGF
jgi:hypothetical protein